jgi:hypothetical protein
MRKKANKADIEYIKNHPNIDPQVISETIDLSLDEVNKYVDTSKKSKITRKLGRSKITLSNGQSVYQMSDDIEFRPTSKKTPTSENDAKAGIYRIQ